MTIEVKMYHPVSGDLFDVRHFDSIEQAFENMIAVGKPALAYPLGCTAGCYNYDPHKDGHTIELFTKILGCCCNDITQYYKNVKTVNE